MEVGELIRQCRKNKGITQEELANTLFVSRQLISKWENGKSYPDLVQLIQLSDYFGLSLDELMRGDQVMITKKDSQIKLLKYGKRSALALILITIVFILYIVTWNIKVHELYRNIEENHWSDEEIYYTKTIDSIQYVVFKNRSYNIFNLPDKLQLQASANYTTGNSAIISGVTIYLDDPKSPFTIQWNNNTLRNQSLIMDETFLYKPELQPVENQNIPYEFKTIFIEELNKEKPYLQTFFKEVKKQWIIINS